MINRRTFLVQSAALVAGGCACPFGSCNAQSVYKGIPIGVITYSYRTMPVGKFKTLEYVKASKQAEAMKNILPLLTEEEDAVFHRGRNIGHTNTPKSATVAEYRAATGMEALFGYLHLAGQKERIGELFDAAYPISENT